MKKLVLVMITLMVMCSPVVNAQVDKKERGINPEKEFEKAYDEGTISYFGCQYLIDFLDLCPYSKYSMFCRTFEEFETTILRGEKFVPEMEELFLREGLSLTDDPLLNLKNAFKQGKLSKKDYKLVKGLYRKQFYNPVYRETFLERYKSISK